MFETETMAELYVKQGLVTKALALYQRLVDLAEDEITRARRRQRIAELEQLGATSPGANIKAAAPTAPTPAATPAPEPLPLPGVRAEWDRRHTTLFWRLPADTVAPALDLLLLMRTPAGIITERRTLPVATVEGRTALAVPDLYAVRVAAGRLDGQRFVPIVRVASDP
ncbi:MAG TPA: hypothetical protein VNO55_28800 [Polyangia bacterium]|nr:hypothetical protein [Polyangia bacterium]